MNARVSRIRRGYKTQLVSVEVGLRNSGELERETAINVGRGLYILRYVTGSLAGVSPVATVRPAPGSEPCIEVISAPGIVTGFFSGPGECAVVRAERAGQLSVKVMRQSAGASIDASFRRAPVRPSNSGRAKNFQLWLGESSMTSAGGS